jgi:hypothetical protein
MSASAHLDVHHGKNIALSCMDELTIAGFCAAAGVNYLPPGAPEFTFEVDDRHRHQQRDRLGRLKRLRNLITASLKKGLPRTPSTYVEASPLLKRARRVPSKLSAAAGARLFSSPFAAGTPCPPPSSPASASSSAAAATNPFTFDPDAAWAELLQLRALFASPVMAEPLGASPTAAQPPMAALQQPVPPPMAALQQPAPEPAPPLDNAKARYRRNGLASQLRALKVARSAERKKLGRPSLNFQLYYNMKIQLFTHIAHKQTGAPQVTILERRAKASAVTRGRARGRTAVRVQRLSNGSPGARQPQLLAGLVLSSLCSAGLHLVRLAGGRRALRLRLGLLHHLRNNAKAPACDGLFLGGCLPRSRRHLLLL